MISKDTKILITGGTGMIGNSLVRTFNYKGYKKIYFPTREKLDLFNLFNTEKYLKADYLSEKTDKKYYPVEPDW